MTDTILRGTVPGPLTDPSDGRAHRVPGRRGDSRGPDLPRATPGGKFARAQ